MDKDYEPVAGVMSLDGKPLIAHDDRLLLRAQKSELGLFDNWRQATQIAWRDGAPVIVRWHHVDDVAKTCSEPPVGEEELWRPQYERVVPHEGVRVSLQCNRCDVELLSLQNDIRSRYRIALEVLADMVRVGVVRYVPRVDAPTERNIFEAIRHRMRRYAKVALYEHNLIFRGELGERILRALEPHDKAGGAYPGTVYLKGFKRYLGLQASVKYYSISQKEKRNDAPEDRLYKLETTLHKDYFKEHGLRDVAQFIEQPDIQEMLEVALSKHLADVIQRLRDGGVDMSQLELGISAGSPRTQARQVLRRELTLTDRVRRLEETAVEHGERLDRIEAHLRQRRKLN